MTYQYKKRQFFKPGGFPVVVIRHQQQEEPVHAHEFSEIVIILGGSGLHGAGRQDAPIRAGDVYVLTGGQQHSYKSPEQLKLINLLFDPAELRMQMRDLKSMPGYHALFTLEPARRSGGRFESYLNLAPKELARLDGWVAELEEELQARRPGYRFMACALFMRIIAHLSRAYHRALSPAPQAILRMGSVLSHLESHYEQAMTLDDLARLARMSKRNFVRTFTQALGQSPISYLIALRIARAAELLRNDSLSVTEVGLAVGFQDGNYFTRQFRQVMNTTPREYRRLRGGVEGGGDSSAVCAPKASEAVMGR